MNEQTVVIGGGSAGTLAANRLQAALKDAGHRIVVIDREDRRDPELDLLAALGIYGPETLQPPSTSSCGRGSAGGSRTPPRSTRTAGRSASPTAPRCPTAYWCWPPGGTGCRPRRAADGSRSPRAACRRRTAPMSSPSSPPGSRRGRRGAAGPDPGGTPGERGPALSGRRRAGRRRRRGHERRVTTPVRTPAHPRPVGGHRPADRAAAPLRPRPAAPLRPSRTHRRRAAISPPAGPWHPYGPCPTPSTPSARHACTGAHHEAPQGRERHDERRRPGP